MMEWVIKYWVQFLFGLLIAALGLMWKKITRYQEEEKALRDGMRSLLKRQLINDCDRYISEGCCSSTDKELLVEMYAAYHALGGNSVVTALKDRVLTLDPPREAA